MTRSDPLLLRCPSCASAGPSPFYELGHVPAHDALLMPSRESALAGAHGDIRLAFCPSCGFIFNASFDPQLQAYAPGYEGTQAFSPTFSAFAQRLASDLIARYDLHGKDILEIGCGMGEFLTLLCQIGDNRGIGFDPAYVPGRVEDDALKRVTFVKDRYSERYAGLRADFLCCKMTLEHISDTAAFVRMVRRGIGDEQHAIIFFQVPNVVRILRELAFWDIYYEHCSYFSLGSLARLFARCGFDVLELWRDYGDQYLMLTARPSSGSPAPLPPQADDQAQLAAYVAHFAAKHAQKLAFWQRRLQEAQQKGRCTVLWGGGSKAVAFLTALGVRDEIACVVDLNPFKQGTYLPGTGHRIVSPESLRACQPDLVIVMNPIYRQEIAAEVRRLGLTPELLAVG